MPQWLAARHTMVICRRTSQPTWSATTAAMQQAAQSWTRQDRCGIVHTNQRGCICRTHRSCHHMCMGWNKPEAASFLSGTVGHSSASVGVAAALCSAWPPAAHIAISAQLSPAALGAPGAPGQPFSSSSDTRSTHNADQTGRHR